MTAAGPPAGSGAGGGGLFSGTGTGQLVPLSAPVRSWEEFKLAVYDAGRVIDRICPLTYQDYLEQVASCDRVRALRREIAGALAVAGRTVGKKSVATQYVESMRTLGRRPDPQTVAGLVGDLALTVLALTAYAGCDARRLQIMAAAVTSETWYDEAGRDDEEFPFEDVCEQLFAQWSQVVPARVMRALILTNAFIRDARPASGLPVTVEEYRRWRWMDSGVYCLWEGWVYASGGDVGEEGFGDVIESCCARCRSGIQAAYFTHDLLTIPSDLVCGEPNVWLVQLSEQGSCQVSATWAQLLTSGLCASSCALAPVIARHMAGSIAWSYLNGRYKSSAMFIRQATTNAGTIDLSGLCQSLLEAIGGGDFAAAIEQARLSDALDSLQQQQHARLSPHHVSQIMRLAGHGSDPARNDGPVGWLTVATAELVAMRADSIPAADIATDLLVSTLTHMLLKSDGLRSYLGFLDSIFNPA